MNEQKWWIITVRSKEYNGRERRVPVQADTLLDAVQALTDDVQWSFYEPIQVEELR